MAKLTSPELTIKLISGTSNADCNATVDVELTPFELFLMREGGLGLRLNCDLMGADDGDPPPFGTGEDDFLVAYPSQMVTQKVSEENTFKFRKTVKRNKLDEDDFPDGKDELIARFTLRSTEPSFPIIVTAESKEITGDF